MQVSMGIDAELPFVAGRLGGKIRPPVPMRFSTWLENNLVLIDGPHAGEKWTAAGAPYLVEIADCLSEDDPCNLVTVQKSEQSGASILALGWCMYVADREPANMLYAAPSIDLLRELNSGKLQPLIDAWQKRIRRVVFAPQTSRQAFGSTTFEKVFSGGRLWLGNANTIMDLSSKTVKKGVKDEVSKWETLDNGADPETLFFGRFTSFRRIKSYKILEISTPEVDTGDIETEGHCRISRSFAKSDQRYWNCPCPACGNLFVHHFERFEIDAEHPHRSGYRHQCGHLINETERVEAIRAGRWIASVDEGKHPGFHIDAFISLMMSYEAIAEDWAGSQKNETAKKDFSTLKLGLPYRFTGDAPDYEKLMGRREDYRRGFIPVGALLVSVAADVQMRGIYYEVVAWKPNRESFVVEAGYLDGDTTEHDAGAFLELTTLFHRRWPDHHGNEYRHDEFGIDANYRTNTVYEWTRRHPGTKALQGRDGWGTPALGLATEQDVDYRGRRIKGGAKLRGVGTWPLKATHYSYLRLTADRPDVFPAGYCHFGTFLDEIYFKQITSEFLAKEKFRGRERQVWKVRGGAENHLLDCRVYNLALVDAYMATLSDEDWRRRAVERGIPADLRTLDLFTPRELLPQPVADAGAGVPSLLAEAPAPVHALPGDHKSHFDALADLNRGV